MKFFLILMIFVTSLLFIISDSSFAQLPSEYKMVQDEYFNEEFGFGLTLPDGMTDYLTDLDNSRTGKIFSIQIHPEFDSSREECCPAVDTSPIVMSLESNPIIMNAISLPPVGDIYASFQDADMNLSIGNIGDMGVLVATLDFERKYREFEEPIRRIGKFYHVNTGERSISYGLLASEENYEKCLNKFEQSPLKQFKSGIHRSDVLCKDGLELAIKNSNLTPACVKPETKVKLFERGWTTDATIYGESSRVCYVEPEIGPCKAAIEKYYFDFESNSCKSFTWGGCQGNVPFDTLSLCQKICN